MLLDDLKKFVGPGGWTTDSAELQPHVTEWRGKVTGATPILVRPRNTQEVVAIVRRCAEDGVGIVPQGGNTGMCAGAVPDESGTQVILSLSRMNRILNMDVANASVEVEAGCILETVQRAAADAGVYFPLSLGAEGSCQIGGNLATNAGGINVLRYGTARAQLLGLEVVLANGTVLNSLRSLRKDTAGYDLKQLFVGSEGTLGIITAAALRLYPDPGPLTTAMAGIPTSGSAVRLLQRLRRQFGERIESFELVSRRNFELVLEHIPETQLPFDERFPWYVLTDLAIDGAADAVAEALAEAAANDEVLDAVIAKSGAEAQALWRMRHSISEAERAGGSALKHDIAVPVSKMEAFLCAGDALLQGIAPDAELFAFGHVGDGNLHYNVRLPDPEQDGTAVTEALYELVSSFGGTFSAEHGVGRLKREWLPKYRTGAEIELMRTLKTTLDPANILNPGKVI